MRRQRKYRVVIEDESRLHDVFSLSMSPLRWIGAGLVFLVVALTVAGTVIYLTPLRSLLPGYMKSGERANTEIGMLRLDSLAEAYRRNESYMKNLMTVLNTDRVPADSAGLATATNLLTADSLAGPSEEESRFVTEVREREKFNISVVAPLAADAMMFVPVSPESIITTDSRARRTARVILADGESPCAVADGRIVGVFRSASGGGNVMVIQHPKGFLSCYSRLGTPLADTGDEVTGGQIIALQATGNGMRGNEIHLQMWHNGTPLIPYEYIGDPARWQRDREQDGPDRE